MTRQSRRELEHRIDKLTEHGQHADASLEDVGRSVTAEFVSYTDEEGNPVDGVESVLEVIDE